MNKIEKNLIDAEIIYPDILVGLTNDQVNKRKEDGLVNKITKTVTKSYFKIIADNVFNFFNILIACISILMIVAATCWPDKLPAPVTPLSFVSAYVLLANILIGIIQDIRARKQVEKLKVVSYPIVRVLRDGKEIEIPANELVLSDIALLKSGDQIIADSVLMEGHIEVNESSLTGESVNVVKNVGDFIYSGSYVTSGTAKVRVEKIGKANYIEKLQSKARKFKRPKSEILRTIKRIFSFIGIVVVVLGVAMIATNLSANKFQERTVTMAGSLIAMIPSGLYLLTSLTLTVGVIRLANRRTLVQELYSLEMLARVDVLCLDKTGTITDGTMRVNKLEVIANYKQDEVENVLLTLVKSTQDSNATALAISEAYSKKVLLPFTKGIPFSSLRKYSAVSLNDGRTFVLGAREFIPHKNDVIDKLCEVYEKQGLRVLFIGYTKKPVTENEKLENVEPVGYLVLEDHIKDDAAETIGWFKNNGVSIKIISGDNPVSVSEIAKRVGVENADKYISLDGMSLEEVRNIANDYTVFGRVSPEQKEVIVESLQNAKHVVAMTGDGVNDVLALKVADCSIAMANGSDAAKAVAHLVSLDSNFATLPHVVAEGRRVINNLQRTCTVFLCKTLFAMITTLVFLILDWSQLDISYPFEPNNLYVWELISIGFASFFLSLQPNSERIKNGFMKGILTKSIPGGLMQALMTIVLFILYRTNVLTFDEFKVVAVLSISTISFVTLLHISRPFDIYRIVLCSAIAFIIPSFFLIDGFGIKGVFKIPYEALSNSKAWIIMIIVVVSTAVIYTGLDHVIARVFKNKKIEVKELWKLQKKFKKLWKMANQLLH